MAVINRIAGFQDDITAWRRHLHAHPELGFQEHATSAFVIEKLREFGVDEIHTGLADTGVVGVIRAGNGKGAIGLRADMDALPIHEETGLPWASTRPGLMHACGHDGHTAMLLGAARYLAETRNFDGTVYLIFQPAEEIGGEGSSGGSRMVSEGLFERFPAQQVFGLHNWPELPVGQFAMGVGAVMAAVDEFIIRILGKGGHAAMPHQCRDPLLAGCQIVQALQSIVARETDPIDNAVVSVTRFHCGEAFNVIAETAEIGGTVRTLKTETRTRIEQRIAAVADAIATAMNVTATIEYERGYPPTVNDAAMAAFGADTAAAVVGEAATDREPLPVMGSEDFAFMLQKRPGAYIWMGNGGGDEGRYCHTPIYDFNDEALPIGASYWATLVERLLPRA